MIHHLGLPPQLPWFQYYLHTCARWTLEYRTKNKTRSDGTQFKPLIIYNKWLFNNQVNNHASSQWLLILPINSVWRITTHKGIWMHTCVCVSTCYSAMPAIACMQHTPLKFSRNPCPSCMVPRFGINWVKTHNYRVNLPFWGRIALNKTVDSSKCLWCLNTLCRQPCLKWMPVGKIFSWSP